MSQSATPATQNDMTTSCDASDKTRSRDFSHRHGNFSLTRVAQLTHGMSQSATPAVQNDVTTSSDTWKKTRLCDFSYWHGNLSLATVLHLTRVECHKVPRLRRKTTEAHLPTSRIRHVCATFPIRTATSASRGLRTSHMWNVTKCHACHASCETSKKTRLCDFSHRHGNFHTSQRQKTTFSYEIFFFNGPTAKSTFCARLPSIFMTCYKMPRLPRNLHLVTICVSADMTTASDTSKK